MGNDENQKLDGIVLQAKCEREPEPKSPAW
jgi:hypothetical protein